MEGWERLVTKLLNKTIKIPKKTKKIPWLMDDPRSIFSNYLYLV